MWTVRYFKSKQYNWAALSAQRSLLAKARRGVLQFTPHSYQDFRWRGSASPRRAAQCTALVALFLLCEVNHFFLKYELWVPPLNPLNTYRLSFMFLMGLPAVKQYYEFMDTEQGDISKLGAYAWLALAIALAETLAVAKWGKG